MELLPIIDEFFQLLWFNFRGVAVTCLTLAVMFVGVYAYFFLRSTTISNEVATPVHWEMWGSVYRLLNYFIASEKDGTDVGRSVRQATRISSNVRIPQTDEICYTDLLNPFKYVTPRVQRGALLRMS